MKKIENSSCPITPLPDYIGPYKVLKKIASGGMGEVFLVQDPFCKRKIALKKIRRDKIDHPGLKERFLKEVKIAAQLSHPSIVPIYQIHQTEKEIYYTMPVVEGDTLKEVLKATRHAEKNGGTKHPIGSSIPALMRIFLNICQAIAYSHAKGILHRDLKPENIIIGTYGEVLILDWGLANYVVSVDIEDDSLHFQEEKEENNLATHLTKPGKIAGTLSYLPPERIFGVKSSYTCDIYALGVILYQLLTLRFPFHRKTIKEYKKQIEHETLIDPSERAPYRDIPLQLSRITKKCLARHKEKRYKTVEEILLDLNNYIEGRADWVPYTSMQIERKTDWKFQENVLLAKHIALTQKSDIMEWVSLMIAKDSFSGKIKLETHVRIKEGGRGIGFLLNLKPREEGGNFFQEGFLLWIGSEQNPGCYLFRSNVELMSNPDLYLKNQLSHFIHIEKTDHHIRLYIDNILAFDYLSHTPFKGPQFGLILKDDDLEVGAILVSTSSPNIQVNCLAVPDALLSLRHFKEALSRYRQIAASFIGRAEGKEALFRAGITLLEEAQITKEKKAKELLLEESLKEFDKFKMESESPLEYLGKSLVYKATCEQEEEFKCLELALRKFEKHPLIHLVKDQILFRLHEASYKDKNSAYALALLTLRFIPEAFAKQDHQKLLQHLHKNCEHLPFLPLEKNHHNLSLQLSFWLVKPLVILDIFHQSTSLDQQINALYCLLYLDYAEKVQHLLGVNEELGNSLFATILLEFYKDGFEKSVKKHFFQIDSFSCFEKRRLFNYFLSRFYTYSREDQEIVVETLDRLSNENLSFEERFFFENKRIEFLFYLKEIKKASLALAAIPPLLKTQESSPFYFLETCLVGAEQGFVSVKKYLSRFSEEFSLSQAYLIAHYLSDNAKWKKNWMAKAFFWEKTRLFEQISLLYLSCGLDSQYKKIQKLMLIEREKIQVQL